MYNYLKSNYSWFLITKETQTVLVLLTSTLEVQEVMLEGSLQLTRLLYWKHWARLLKKKRTKNWYGKSATAIIGNNACAGWAISAVKTKQGEGDKTGTCFCVYHILRLWLCYDGDTENELNIINFFDMFKENSSNKFKVKANMFSESKRKMRLSNSINSSTVFVHWCADHNHSWYHHVITEERFSHLYNFERFGVQLEQ